MTRPRCWIAPALALSVPLLLATPAFAPAADKEDASRAAIQRAVDAVYPALVRIHVVTEEGEGGRMQKRRGSGSGTILSEDGYILTNHHVAGRGTRIVCTLSNREEVDAELIGTDALSDLAILKIDPKSRRNSKVPLAVAKFGDSDKLKVGDAVLAMGSPAGLSQSVTRGIVANTAMISPYGSSLSLDGERVGELVRWIGHDAVIFPGNSGGPLVNLKGEIIGVNEVSIGSLGGAIPSNLAQSVAKELIKKGSVSRSWIGLEVQPLLKKTLAARGVLVSTVLSGSPAETAGLRAGDFLADYDGQPIPESRAPEDLPLFNRMVLTTPVGAAVTIKGTRDGQPMTWRMNTAEREPNVAKETELVNWGLTVRDFTRVSALEWERTNRAGVFVDSVRPGGPTAESKPSLREGDVITRAGETVISNTLALTRFTSNWTQGLKEPKALLVTFERDGQEFATVARIGPEVQDDKPARPAKAWLGVATQVLTRELAEAMGLDGKKGVRVTKVQPGSPAAKAGVQPGDIFTKLDDEPIAASAPSDQELFENLIRQSRPNTQAELQGFRAGKPLKLTATLGHQPKPASELDEFKDERFEFTARDLSVTDRLAAKISEADQGVRVASVQYAGWAALSGLSSGDTLLQIDGEPVSGIAGLKSVMDRMHESKPRRVVFFIKRGIRTMFLELEPKW